MAKISLIDLLGGSIAQINNNFTLIRNALNNRVMWRDNPLGEPNQMLTTIDMNSNRIINLPAPVDGKDPLRKQDLIDLSAAFVGPPGPVGPPDTAFRDVLNSSSGSSYISTISSLTSAVVRTLKDKVADQVDVADFGALGNGVANDAPAIQAALNTGYTTLGTKTYVVTSPLKIPSLSNFMGRKSGMAFIGSTAAIKHSIKKTNNATVNVTNFETNVTTARDCIAYVDPYWIDGGAAYPQKATIDSVSFQGNLASPNGFGLYIEQGGGYNFNNLDFCYTLNAIFAKDVWLTTLNRVHALGKIVWTGGTSVTFKDVWTGSGPGSNGGFVISNLFYSHFSGCGSDGAKDTAYRFNNSRLVIDGSGCENATASSANSGTAIAFDGNNQITVNGFNVVPQVNQVIPPYTVGFNDVVTFNGGSSYFAVSGVNCPDLYVWGNGSTVVFDNYQFVSGGRDTPLIQFATGITTSKVVVKYPGNSKTYTSDGTGAVLVETEFETSTFTPSLTFGGAKVGMESSGFGTLRKSGKVITGSARITLTNKGTSTGQAVLSGWKNHSVATDADLGISVLTGVTGGPFVGSINGSSTGQAVLSVRSATGDVGVTDANFTNTSVVWFNFTYQIP